jgi:hypothetical protein
MCGILTNVIEPVTCENCSSKFPTASSTLLLKAHFVDVASRWIGSGNPLAEEKFNAVVNAAVAAGVNPVFALSSWLLESGASNYDGICLKLGGGDPSSTYCNHLLDFGVFKDEIASGYTTGKSYFSEQLRQYLDLPGYYKDVCKAEMEATSCPMQVFTAMFYDGNCQPSDASDKYYASIKGIYKLIAPAEEFPCYPIAYP